MLTERIQDCRSQKKNIIEKKLSFLCLQQFPKCQLHFHCDLLKSILKIHEFFCVNLDIEVIPISYL